MRLVRRSKGAVAREASGIGTKGVCTVGVPCVMDPVLDVVVRLLSPAKKKTQ